MNEIQQGRPETFKPNILFVDDEKSILDSLRRVCRTMKCQVFVADGGRAGLDIMAENRIDLVVSDMRMPEMTGSEFLEQVAQQYPGTVRILLTGYSDMESTIAAINQGRIYSYISKPWDNEQLKVLIEKALYTKRLEDEHKQLLELTRAQNAQLKALNESLEEKVAQRTEALQRTVSKLDNAHAQLKNSYSTSVEVFSRLIELREDKSSGQGGTVAEHVRLIAGKMELDTPRTEQLYYAALLRNIGKMGLSDAALKQPYEALGDRDRVAYRKYPAMGEALLMSVEALQEAAACIRSHRERLDGKGFPDGLTEEKIPLEARILGAVSDYDDLINGMLTKAKLTPEDAQAYLKSQTGKRYDAIVVDAYLEILAALDATMVGQNELIVQASDLKVGMVLSRDLIMPEGLLLLSSNQELSERLIDKISQFEQGSSEKFCIYVYEGH